MKNYSLMIKPASSLCNLRCKYCFYADLARNRDVDSFGIMSEQTMTAMLKHVQEDLEAGDHISFVFQGGEPTLAGLDYFRRFTAITDSWDPRIHVHYALQTNGILLNDEWCDFLGKYSFLVGVSLDILPEHHDSVRVGPEGGKTYKHILQKIKLLEWHKVEYNVLCTLTNRIARHPKQVWKQIGQMNLKYVQFTPCLNDLDASELNVYALTPERFFSFYDQLFDDWLKEFKKGNYRSIKLFDDIVNLLAYGMPTACGMTGNCQPQLIIEADGSAYPCDFYCLDEYYLGNITEKSVAELRESPAVQRFYARPRPKPEHCADCPFWPLCGGGCRRMQENVCCSETGDFCGYRALLERHIGQFEAIAKLQLQ